MSPVCNLNHQRSTGRVQPVAPTENTLADGEARIGFIFDEDPRTAHMATLLSNADDEITLAVPWISRLVGDEYRRWFLSDYASFGDDEDRTRYSYEIPEELHFKDARGSVCLVGTYGALWRERGLGRSRGQGTLKIRFVVLGVERSSYLTIDSLQSELEGLGDWLRVRSMEQGIERDEAGRVKRIDIQLETPPPIIVANEMGVRFVPSFRTSKGQADETVITERVLVETDDSEPRSWEEHLQIHHAVRDLLRISAWQPLNYLAHRARRKDDPDLVASGDIADRPWRKVVTHETGIKAPTENSPSFMFLFADVGAEGIARWFSLRNHFARGIDIMMSLFENTASINTRIAESGMAMEALGYLLARESGISSKIAKNESHERRLERIVENSRPNVLVLESDQWLQRAAAVYNSVKHANRKLPDAASARLSWLEMSLLFRLWVSKRIGVDGSKVDGGFEMNQQYKTIEYLRKQVTPQS